MVKMIRTFNPKTVVTASNIQVDATSLYVSTDTYSTGDERQYNEIVWRSVADGNIGNTPELGSSFWIDVRPINEVAVFDDYPSTVSINNAEDLMLEFKVDFLKLIVLSEIYGTELKIELINNFDDAVVYTNTISLIEYQEPQNAYEMKYFWDIEELKTEHFEDIAQPEFNQTLRVTITQKNSIASLGFIDFGGEFIVGCRGYNGVTKKASATSDFVSFANKIKPELFPLVESMEIKMIITENIPSVEKEMKKRIGTRNVVIAPADGDVLNHLIIGYFQNFDRSETAYSKMYESTLEIKKIENTIQGV